jgi:hypothetical protein
MKGRLTMCDDVKKAALEILENRIGGVDRDDVATALADNIVNRAGFIHEPEDAIQAGIEAAIEEIDDATFDAAFDVIQTAVAAEVESQAKAIALRLLRQLAATAKREEVATA